MRAFISIYVATALTLPLFAANHYIRDGGTGDGTAWDNALDSLQATLTRGDTYYLADGTYPAYTFDDAASGATLITIKKATASDHGSDTGWSSDYGDGEAVFSGSAVVWTITSGYWLIDGQHGYGKDPGRYGIRVYSSRSRGSSGAIVDSSDQSNITVRHVEFDWDNGTGTSATAAPTVWGNWGTVAQSNITISSCYFHHAPAYVFYWGQYGTPGNTQSSHVIEDCYFYRIGGGGGVSAHWEMMWLLWANEFDFRRNTIEDVFGATDAQTGWLMVGGSTNVRYTSNLFFGGDSAYTGVGNNGIIATWSNDVYVNSGVYIIGNTFADITGGYAGSTGPSIRFTHNSANDTNVVLKNNLFFLSSCEFADIDTATHNAFGGGLSPTGTDAQTDLASTVFISYAGNNFELSSGTTSGDSDVGAAYNTDALGNARGEDGTWDRGAYEFEAAPTAPNTATLAAYRNTGGTIAWTDASNNETGFEVDRSPDNSTWTQIATTAANATSYTDSSANAGTTYYYRVRATNGAGDSADATPTPTSIVTAPPAPVYRGRAGTPGGGF